MKEREAAGLLQGGRLPRFEPVRVCMLTNSVYSRDIRIRRYSEYLADDGHFVDVIGLAAEGGKEVSRHPHITVYPIPMTRQRKDGAGLVVNWALCAGMMLFMTSGLDLKNGYDLIHVHNMPDFLVFCAIVPRLRGCPVILNVHDPMPELARSKMDLSPRHPIVRAQEFIERLSVRFSNHVITATPAFRKVLMERGVPADKITVVTNAADERFFRSPGTRAADRRREGFRLLYVGTVAYRYGLDVCVRAMAILRDRIPGLELRVVPKIRGEGKALDDCLKLAEDLGVADAVRLEDPVPLEEMPGIMSDADIGVYPARSDCHMDVALSLKIPEMIATGLPVVATRLPVLEELYGDDVIAFVPPGDPQAFAEKVLELYQSPEKVERMTREGLKKASEFTWRNQYIIYRNLLESLLGRQLHTDEISPPKA